MNSLYIFDDKEFDGLQRKEEILVKFERVNIGCSFAVGSTSEIYEEKEKLQLNPLLENAILPVKYRQALFIKNGFKEFVIYITTPYKGEKFLRCATYENFCGFYLNDFNDAHPGGRRMPGKLLSPIKELQKTPEEYEEKQ